MHTHTHPALPRLGVGLPSQPGKRDDLEVVISIFQGKKIKGPNKLLKNIFWKAVIK